MNAPHRNQASSPRQLRCLSNLRTRIATVVTVTALLQSCAAVAPPPAAFGSHDGPCQEDRLMTDHLATLPGVRVVRAAGGYQVRVRGAPAEPLFILDGLPLAPQPSGALNQAVNPCDVASIRVLSDAAELTYYGARGGNGVVLITTRRH